MQRFVSFQNASVVKVAASARRISQFIIGDDVWLRTPFKKVHLGLVWVKI